MIDIDRAINGQIHEHTDSGVDLEEATIEAISDIIDQVILNDEAVVGSSYITKAEILEVYPLELNGTLEDSVLEYLENEGSDFVTLHIEASH